MKKTLATALIALTAVAGAASAMTNDQLRNTVENQIGQFPVAVDVDALSDAQVSALALVVNSGDSSAEKVRAIKSITR